MVPLTLQLIDFLLTDEAQRVLASLASDARRPGSELAVLSRLRRVVRPDQAAALLDQARLRSKAGDKFPQPDRLLYVAEALEQASSRRVARYRARQFSAALAALSTDRSDQPAGRPLVADLGCGIGADTIALAEAGLQVLAVEQDPVRARVAEVNVAALGLAQRVQVLCADWTTLQLAVDAAFVDPDRRRDDRRLFRLDQMLPPIDAVLALQAQVPHVAVKTAPGIADEDIPGGAEVEFISERGHMKEALLRFDELRLGARRTATLLPGPVHLDSNAPLRDVPVSEPRAYLYEPDPAILRAGLVQHLATRLGAAQLDVTIAYLTADYREETPLARAWPVLRHGPFRLKTLNQWLREVDAGEVVVKKRGSAVDPDQFRRRLKTSSTGRPLVVFLTRMQGRPWMILGAHHG